MYILLCIAEYSDRKQIYITYLRQYHTPTERPHKTHREPAQTAGTSTDRIIIYCLSVPALKVRTGSENARNFSADILQYFYFSGADTAPTAGIIPVLYIIISAVLYFPFIRVILLLFRVDPSGAIQPTPTKIILFFPLIISAVFSVFVPVIPVLYFRLACYSLFAKVICYNILCVQIPTAYQHTQCNARQPRSSDTGRKTQSNA